MVHPAAADAPVALITAASRGVGAACARRLAADGYRVALLARTHGVEELAVELGGIGVTGSVTDPADLRRLVRESLEAFGRIDAVVNNTGHPAKGELLELADEDWHDGLDLILLSVLRLAREVTPVMERQGGGALVNVSSLWAAEPSLDAPVSSTLRAALSALTKLYADRFAPRGIRINTVLAGFFDSHPVSEDVRRGIPVGRVASVDEIASVVAFLLSPQASYVTGQSLRADGGLTRSVSL
jgi:NAD(P)-dependent dehydrogenase (short-subunit alcohol dehydrogenase family)